MAKVNKVQKARKDYPEQGIKKGDTYYWWQFRFGGLHRSKTPPKRSQLTQSSFMSQLYELEDELSNRFNGLETSDDIQGEIDNLVSDLDNLIDETQGSLDNMPQQLQDGDTGQMLQERIDGLESWKSDLESIDTDIDEELSAEEKVERAQEIIEEISGTSAGL